MQSIRKVFVLIVLPLLSGSLLACGSSPTPPFVPTANETNLPPMTLVSPAPTKSPVLTTSPVPSVPETIPTSTMLPTPQPTVATILEKYTLPAWLSDPNAVILMTITRASAKNFYLTFVNVPSGMQFDLPMAKVNGYFWMPDGQHFGLLSADNQLIYLVDVTDGEVRHYPIDERVTRFIQVGFPSPYPAPLQAYGTLPDAEDFFLLYPSRRYGLPYHPTFLSPDGEYLARHIFEPQEWTITIEEVASGDMLQLTDPNDGLYDFGLAWSPTMPYLAVLQGTKPCGPYSVPSDRIQIYDATDGTVVASYQGGYGQAIEWSPDSSYILYQESIDEYSTRNAPCFLDWQTGRDFCIDEFDDRYAQPYTFTTYFGWSADGQRIFYVYYGIEEPGQAGLCFLEWANGAVSCPTTGLPDLKGRDVIAYDLSPDGQYVAFLFAPFCPPCDDRTGTMLSAIMAIDGSGYYLLGEEDFAKKQRGNIVSSIQFPYHAILWRPIVLLPPPAP